MLSHAANGREQSSCVSTVSVFPLQGKVYLDDLLEVR